MFYSRTEVVEFYKTSKLENIEKSDPAVITPPPWIGIPPELEIYRQRGHRRLDPGRIPPIAGHVYGAVSCRLR